jgi:hypothetical protein
MAAVRGIGFDPLSGLCRLLLLLVLLPLHLQLQNVRKAQQ